MMGFTDDFFSLGRLTYVAEHYAKSRKTEIEVEVSLYDGERFLVALVQVWGSNLVFQTEDGQLVCVPVSGVAKVWIRPRPRGGKTGFQGVEQMDAADRKS